MNAASLRTGITTETNGQAVPLSPAGARSASLIVNSSSCGSSTRRPGAHRPSSAGSSADRLAVDADRALRQQALVELAHRGPAVDPAAATQHALECCRDRLGPVVRGHDASLDAADPLAHVA